MGGAARVFGVNGFSVGIVELGTETHFLGKTPDDFHVGQRLAGGIDSFGQVRYPAFGVGHRAFLFQPGGGWQHHIGEGHGVGAGRYVLHDYEAGIFERTFGGVHIGHTHRRIGVDNPDRF